MTKIAHLSDLHLGYSSGRKKIDENGYNVRENDGYVAYNLIIDQIIEEDDVDIVLIAGDMFHSPRPKNHTIIVAQEGLRRLAEAGIKVYIIAGNHDATDIRAEIPSSKILHEPGSGIYSYSEPYVVEEIADGIYMHFVSHHAFIDQEETMEQIKLVDGKVNILASHGSCYDTNIGMILRTPNEPREVIIPEAIINMDWDYTWLGHIHERGWISSTDGKTDTANRKQFYNGSILRRGFADKPSKLGRGWTKWTIDGKEITPEMFTIPERPQFDMHPIDIRDKKPIEIESEIIEQLNAIDNFLEREYGGLTQESMPIVRQTIIGVNAITKLPLNLQRFNDYTSKYLIHNFKVVPDENKVDLTSTVTIDALNSSDIVVVFNKWCEGNKDLIPIEEDLIDEVTTIAEEQLKISRDSLLTED